MKRMMGCLVVICMCLTAVFPMCTDAAGGIPVGGIELLMTDVAGQPLESAAFEILREAGGEELGDHAVEKRMVKIGEEHRIMTVESFWTSAEMEGQKQAEVLTGADGRAGIYGLNYGTYFLLETRAPEGFNRIREPIRITVHKYSHLTAADGVRDDAGKLIDNTLQIINLRYTLPDTKTWGVVQLAAAGTGILFSSAALLLLGRKRR